MSPGEYGSRHGELPREERLKDALQTLEHGIDSILTSDGFASYLRTLARFHSYSFGNVVLIRAQRPDATRVAGYRKWLELGRQVKKGEQGIKILVPFKHKATVGPEDDEDNVVVKSFGVGTVLDVAQTDGDPLPDPPTVEHIGGASDRGMRLFVDLIDYLELQNVPVTRETTKPANGYFDPMRRRVALDVDLDGDQATKTLTHEASHVVASHTLGMDSRDVETVAESAAFVIMNHYGIDSSGYTFPYVAGWAQDRTILKRNLGAVQQTAHRIIVDLEGESE
jgi:N-terminal domain of anti-restriction factor ArdC